MNPAILNISLDVNAAGSQESVQLRQYDSGRIIKASLRENQQPYKFTEGCTAVFAAKKPDGTLIFNDCTFQDDLAVYKITEQTTAAPGVAEAEIRIYDKENHLLVSPAFDMVVHPAVYSDSEIQSTNELTTLTGLISEAIALIDNTNAALANGDFVPNLTIGDVASLPSYVQATASITGTGKNPVLNLGIPRGGNGSEVNHNLLLGLNLPNQHPITAVIGLQDVLDGKQAAGDYALKSELPTALSELAEDASHRVVTDAEKQTWNGKQNALGEGDVAGSMIAPGAVDNDKLSPELQTTISGKAPANTFGEEDREDGSPSSDPEGSIYWVVSRLG